MVNLIYVLILWATPITLLAQFSFGDNTSAYALDGECDDPRFQGQGMSELLVYSDLYRDASDCSTLFDSGSISLRSDLAFGDNTSAYALDGECDDPRFQGQGMAAVLNNDNTGRDATDCRLLFNQSAISVLSIRAEE
jgi:hypothetical protein